MTPARPVPIVRRAPAAGLFGRRSETGPAKTGTVPVFPWEELLFAPDAVAPRQPPVILRFPTDRR
jgi:hypothetical protein